MTSRDACKSFWKIAIATHAFFKVGIVQKKILTISCGFRLFLYLLLLLLLLLCSKTICVHSVREQHRAHSVACELSKT